ncbi:MAG: class I SAM-dependent methyltransferase [Acidobacteria bacterium]|nr:class I SAM-dependent methyltransferase [Acidobacteriota bacterium]
MMRSAAGVSCLLMLLAGCRREEAGVARGGGAAGEGDRVYELFFSDKVHQDRLVRGLYPGTEGWLWTGRQFAVTLDVPPPLDAETFLRLDFAVPVEVIGQVPSVTVTAKVNGKALGRKTYDREGRYSLVVRVPRELLKSPRLLAEFELDRTAKEAGSGRELGVIAVWAAMTHPESTVLTAEAATERAQQGYRELLKQRRLQLPPEKQNELMKLFHDLAVWRHTWFQNVQIEKNPLDLWMMQQIVHEVKPDFIVETGTYRGGSALYWAYTLNGLGLENSRVITVDVQDLTATAAAHPLWQRYVTFLKGSSTDAAITGRIAGLVRGRRTLVTLDSDHTMGHVLKELRAYSGMVSRGSYLVVEDTHMDGVPTAPGFGPGPMAAVLEFLKEGGAKEFEQDFSREAMVMTFNPGGWLRRRGGTAGRVTPD